MSTNIGNSDDPFYRYKRPLAIVENRGKTTSIKNLDAISKSLDTKSNYLLYYIQLEKSTSVTKGTINTILSSKQIEEMVNGFINKYILCKSCAYPELMIQEDGQKLFWKCKACGHHEEIPLDKFTKVIHRDYQT